MSKPSHPGCVRPDGHICQQPSGLECYEQECDLAAGTLWGPYWCPEHDAERLDRITTNLDNILSSMEEAAADE